MSDNEDKMRDICLSLDEYAAKKRIAAWQHRKRIRNIDINELNKELEVLSPPSTAGEQTTEQSSSCSRYNRRSMVENSDDSDDDLQTTNKLFDDDVVMKDNNLIKVKIERAADEEEEEDELNDLQKFQTIETKQGIRVRSQQWRMLPENLVDRPAGVKRLEVLPLDEHERYRRVQRGRIDKTYRSRTSSVSSLATASVKDGYFLEKGSLTYKYGDRNGSGEGLIGIERSKRFVQPQQRQHFGQPQQRQRFGLNNPPININMNWEGFFQGFNQTIEQIREPPAGDDILSTASKLLNALQNNRYRVNQSSPVLKNLRKEVEDIQGKPLKFM
ncbi:CLUMA_CG019530, isoform A [Clunio marinus]|uniref:CLUMA_CG019530, isoform A n=1 Tax=Clunio marinus TaxID=568069 RepID=A0A1J1J5F4_9DIPT|nr:CLUMA_CG019530, isoform A [Clunio marinus]